jgi:integrase
VVTVYKQVHPTYKTGWRYELIYTTPEGRRKRNFAKPEDALAEARIVASKLAAGRIEGAEMSRGERDEYLAAKDIAGSFPLISALKEWAKVRELCGSDLVAAAQAWHEANGKARKQIDMANLVEAFRKDKERSGVDTRAGYARTLPRLVESFADTPVHALTSQMLKEWLHRTFTQTGQRHVNASTFNSHRKRMVALWKWARDEGYLPRNAQTEIEQVKTMREESQPIGILTVPNYAAILELVQKQHPAYLATTVLAGFAGLRRCELHAQKWDQIDLKRRLLTVSKAKRNTPSMRIVHLCPAAVEWLLGCNRIGELVSPAWGLDRVRAYVRGAKIPSPSNAFRHSFITYRVAATGNVDETSLEAGNSRDEVFRSYRELVSKEEGEDWFSLAPSKIKSFANIFKLKDCPIAGTPTEALEKDQAGAKLVGT